MYTPDTVGPVTICGVGGGTKGEVEGKIVEASTEATVDDAEEVLTGASPGGVGNADDNANDSGAVPVGRVGGGTKVVVDGRIVEALTGAGVGDAEDVVAVRGPEG